MGQYKPEYPPLLAQGFHALSIDELRQLCVTSFVESRLRPQIMAGFEIVYERALAVGLAGEIWIDGSFLTKKREPEDIDFIFLLDAGLYEAGSAEQNEFIEWLIDNEDDPKRSFLCHTDVILEYPQDSPLRSLTVESKRHWEKVVYGFSVTTHEPKGIAVLKFGEVK